MDQKPVDGISNLTPEQIQNLREYWQREHRGLSNAHRVRIMPERSRLRAIGDAIVHYWRWWEVRG